MERLVAIVGHHPVEQHSQEISQHPRGSGVKINFEAEQEAREGC